MASINYLLKTFSSALYLSQASAEGLKIHNSVNYLTTNLSNYFGTDIRVVKKFGSYTRGTILPRYYDEYSDIDLMVVFNREDYQNVTPGSLRRRLINFANARYATSLSYRDQPVVVLELQHIRYDLVPTIITGYGYSWASTYISQDDSYWQLTYPDEFNNSLTQANVQYDSIVKPIIRLLKAWNAKVNYPLKSFALEQEVAAMNFSGDNYERGFFYAIDQLRQYGYSQNVQNKIDALKKNAERVKNALATDREITARDWLTHILPIEKNW